MARKKLARFDAADYLDNEDVIAEYLDAALAPGAKPRYDTVLKRVRAPGVQLHAGRRPGGGVTRRSRSATTPP